MKVIYTADDEKNIRNLIKTFLEKEGYDVKVFETGDKLFEEFQRKHSDLVILDVMMPGSDGFSICSKIRAISNVPIIMLTARDTEADYIAGLTLGSDDYFTKPFSPVSLSMKVKAIFRRIEMDKASDQKELLSFGDIEISSEMKTVYCNKKEMTLTMTEFNLLSYMVENNNKVVSREELLNKIWGYDKIVETRATDDTVKRLRKKVSEIGSNVNIATVWGFGFKLEVKNGKNKL